MNSASFSQLLAAREALAAVDGCEDANAAADEFLCVAYAAQGILPDSVVLRLRPRLTAWAHPPVSLHCQAAPVAPLRVPPQKRQERLSDWRPFAVVQAAANGY